MTKRQAEVVNAIIALQSQGCAPSRDQLATRLGIGGRAVQRHLFNLEAQDRITREGTSGYSYGTRLLRVIWPAKNLIRPPYRMLWEMVDGRLVYGPRDIRASRRDQQKQVFGV